MAKRLQHRGGTTSQHSSFTGAVREVTVDTDKNTLVVHDGATAGGHPLATATNFKSTGIDDNATSTAISIDSSQNVSFNDDTGNTEKLVWNATDESLILKYHPTYGDYYIAYKVPQVVAGGVTSDVVLLIGEKDVNQIRIQGRFYTPLPPNINDNRNAFIVDIIYQQWNGQLPRFSYDAIHTGSRANTVDNMELGEAVYNGTTYYAIKIQANYASLSGVPIYFTGGITNTTDLGWLPEGNLTSFTAVTPSSQDSSDKRISAENIRFKNEKNEDKMLITSDGNISFYEDTGITPKFFWDASAEALGIGTSSPVRDLVIKNSAGDAGFRMETASYTNDVLTLRNSNGRLDFGALAMTILTNGNVGIGITTPASKLEIYSTATFNARTSGINIHRPGSYGQYASISFNSASTYFSSTYNGAGAGSYGDFKWQAYDTTSTPVERMRIDSSGNLLVGKTGTSNVNNGFALVPNGASNIVRDGGLCMQFNRKTSDGDILQFLKDATTVGSISVTASATSYNTTSDKRLKDNIQTITDGTEKVMAMNAVTHTWKNKPDTKPVHGFIAQEMQQIIPEAVTGNPDSEEMMSMDYGRITPLLVASLQDAHKKIKELENKINNMENK